MKLRLNNFHLLIVAGATFIFVSTTAMSINKVATERKTDSVSSKVLSAKTFPDNPVLKNGSTFPILSAQGVMASDLGSSVPLYEKNTDTKLLPASTTKIITALVSLDIYELNDVLTVPKGVNVDGQKMGLFTGEQMKVEDLLYGLLVYSANDAAMTLAINHPDGYDAFIDAMNKKAIELNMKNSYFENPVGLDGSSQSTTAKDLLRVSEVAMRNPTFAKIVGTKSIIVTDITGKTKYNLKNINELLGNTPGVMGIKTGWTENARENLVTFVERDGHSVIVVILGSQDRFGETKELIDWIFENYEWQKVTIPTPQNSK